MIRIFGLGLLTFFLTNSIFGSVDMVTSKTLPQGVWFLNAGYANQTVKEVGYLNGEDYEFVKLENYTVDIGMAPLTNFGVSGNTRMADGFVDTVMNVNLSYGLTNKLTLSFQLPYVQREISYNKTFTQQVNSIDKTIRDTYGVIVPPATASGKGLGDGTLGAKYNVAENFSLAYLTQSGFLKFGDDGTEIKDKYDGFEQLVTGKKADRHTFAVFYDIVRPNSVWNVFASYHHSSRGYEKILDNDFEKDDGDIVMASIARQFQLTPKLRTKFGLTGIHSYRDKKVEDGRLVSVSKSESDYVYSSIYVGYAPAIFAHLFFEANIPLHHKVAGTFYDAPGRLDPGVTMQFGMNLFYKHM